jgi:hypothetical protein
MTTEPTPTPKPELPKFDIPKGWNCLYDPATKKAFVVKHFPLGGKATSLLSLVTAPTELELRAEMTLLALVEVEKKTPPAQA